VDVAETTVVDVLETTVVDLAETTAVDVVETTVVVTDDIGDEKVDITVGVRIVGLVVDAEGKVKFVVTSKVVSLVVGPLVPNFTVVKVVVKVDIRGAVIKTLHILFMVTDVFAWL